MTAAEVDSGLVLHSYYGGKGHPVAKLTLTASAKDPVTGAVKKAAPQTITVTDPPPTATTTTTSPHTTAVTSHPTSTNSGLAAGQSTDRVSSTVATIVPKPITVTDPAPAAPTTAASPANQGSALFSQIRDLVANGGVATSVPHPITVADPAPATGTTHSVACKPELCAAEPVSGRQRRPGRSGSDRCGRVERRRLGAGHVPDQTATLIRFRTRALGARARHHQFWECIKEHRTRTYSREGLS